MQAHTRFRILLAAVLGLTLVSCTGGQARGPQDTLRRYIAAIRADQPAVAYALLDESVRRQITLSEYSVRWKELRPELLVQADQLQQRLGGEPVVISSQVTFPEGTRARLRFVDNEWRIEDGISVAVGGSTPVEAIRAFLRAVEMRSYEGVMRMLARSVRASLERDINERAARLKNGLKNEVEVTGDRARLQYDTRFKIELIREDGQWKILDFD